MPRVTIVLIRHSISCANYYHNQSYRTDDCDPLVAAIIKIPDPALTRNGVIMAREYGPTIQSRLAVAGVDLDTAFFGASALKRAPQTATLLFPGKTIATVPHITEYGSDPVNTPTGGLKHESSWPLALRYLATLAQKGHTELVLVSHGNYMKDEVMPTMSGLTNKDRTAWMGNLDTLVIRGFLTNAGHLLQPTATKITYDGRLTHESKGDRCSLPRHLSYIKQLARRTKKQQIRDQERASGEGQGQGQDGGFFSPSVMGAFAANGMKLLPAAAYLGYKMYKKQSGSGATRKRRRRPVRT